MQKKNIQKLSNKNLKYTKSIQKYIIILYKKTKI